MPLRTLRIASLLEAVTLFLLVFVAVPLKHLAGHALATRWIGPIHGAAFVLYLWALLESVAAGGWRPKEAARMVLVACVPLAGFLNQPWLLRKARSLEPHPADPS